MVDYTIDVNDQIFGLITIPSYIQVIIDTAEFQRLRWICQLGITPFVYPTANHTRFEHSIGTFYLASKLIKKLRDQIVRENITEISITEVDIIAVEIAALCHDIGHGPFSHMWDSMVVTRLAQITGNGVRSICHEDMFKDMWKIIKRNNPKIAIELEARNINFEVEERLFRLVKGCMDSVKDAGKDILFQIVSNSQSGLDVDKLDYLARDSYNLGLSSTDYKVEINRIIHYSRAIKTEEGIWEIGFRDKELLGILGVFQMRNLLHRKAYQHKTCKAIELMMFDGIKHCLDNKIGIQYKDINDPEWLICTTDGLFWQLSQMSKYDIFQRILRRDLYKLKFKAYKKTSETINMKEVTDFFRESLPEIDPTLYRITETKFSLGNNIDHPLSKVRFFDRDNHLVDDLDYDRFCVNFNESELRIYYTKSLEVVQDGHFKSVFANWCNLNHYTFNQTK